MSWIDNIRQKPQATKIRIMWTLTAIIFILLIIAWVISYRYHKHVPVDTTLFRTIGRGVDDVKNNYNK